MTNKDKSEIKSLKGTVFTDKFIEQFDKERKEVVAMFKKESGQ